MMLNLVVPYGCWRPYAVAATNSHRFGHSGQIGYALCPMVAAGRMLGPSQPVILHLLDIERAAEALEGIKMELHDAAFPLLAGACRGD